MRKQLNFKALLILTLSILALGTSAYFVHAFQVKRHAKSLLEEASQFENEGKIDLAIDCLSQYIVLASDDADAKARYALLLSKTAANPKKKLQAYLALSAAVRADQTRQDARRELAKLTVGFGLFSEAREHLAILRDKYPEDAAILALSARSAMMEKNTNEAIEWYGKAFEAAKRADVELAVEFANVLRTLPTPQPGRADGIIDQMRVATEYSPDARTAAARYFRHFGVLEKAEQALAKEPKKDANQESAPQADELYISAQVARDRNKIDAAREMLQRGFREFPADSRFAIELARLELEAGRREQAQECLKTVFVKPSDTPEQLWNVSNLLVELERPDEVEKAIALLDQKSSWAMSSLLRARLLMSKSLWGDATKLLEKTRPTVGLASEAARSATRLLVDCYGHLLNPDKQLEVWQQALKLDPNWLDGQRRFAEMLAANGKFDEAAAIRQRISESPADKVALAHLLISRNLRLPLPQRIWSEVDKIIEQLAGSPLGAPALNLLQAEELSAQNQIEPARQKAMAARDGDPTRFEPWMLLISLPQKKEDGQSFAALIDEAERNVGSRLEWSLLRTWLWLQASAESRKTLPDPLTELDKFKGKGRNQLLAALAERFTAAGERTIALRLWTELCERDPANFGAWLGQFDLVLEAKDWNAAQRCLEQIKRMEGADGPQSLCCDAALRLARSGPDDRQAWAEARSTAERAAVLRPAWTKPLLIEAVSYEREGRFGPALEKYKAAMEHGENRLSVARRALELMYAQRLYGEAEELLRKLPERAMSSGGVGRVAALVSLETAGHEGHDLQAGRRKALELARKVAADSTNYRDLAWLGQIAALAGETNEAEKAFRRACQLNEKAPDSWIALVGFLARTDPKRADAAIDEAKKHLPPEQLPLALAFLYETVGRTAQVEEQYLAALKEHPADPDLLRHYANYQVRIGQTAKAIPSLRKLIEVATATQDNPTVMWGRRHLAVALAFEGGYQRFREAEDLLDKNLKHSHDSVEDRQAKALVNATRSDHRHDAIQLFESLGPPSRSVLFLLARLHDADGNWPAADREYQGLLKSGGKNAVVLASYIRGLLRQHKAGEAQKWLHEMNSLAPNSLEALELHVLVDKESGRSDEAVELVQAYEKAKDARLDLAARWFEILDRPADAERTLRAFVESSKDNRPNRTLQLALFMGRQKKVADALDLCEQAFGTVRPETVANCAVVILRTGGGTEEHRQRVENWIKAEVAKQPQQVFLLVLLAEIEEQRNNFDAAMDLYSKVLKNDSSNVMALNNLANILALKGARLEEAFGYIEKAISLAGQTPELLDTRAMVNLRRANPGLAVQDLEDAVGIAGVAPAFLYAHLAQAQLATKDQVAAAKTYHQARNVGFQIDMLHPLEREAFRKLLPSLQ